MIHVPKIIKFCQSFRGKGKIEKILDSVDDSENASEGEIVMFP